ncbi:hypothetical protein BC826DRAFT_1049325 [Russula brevipes]|nr:hypothetical protein BC826DRAFT_1049325 [Russula brevipes]
MAWLHLAISAVLINCWKHGTENRTKLVVNECDFEVLSGILTQVGGVAIFGRRARACTASTRGSRTRPIQPPHLLRELVDRERIR